MLKDLFCCPQPQPTKKQELRPGAHAPHSSAIRPLPSGKMMAGHRKHPCNQVHAIILRTISVNSKQPWGFDKLLRFFNPGDCRRALADDQDDRVLILGAVPMDCLPKWVTKVPAVIGTVLAGSNLLPVPTHHVPLSTVMNRSLGWKCGRLKLLPASHLLITI